jgi:hypothetical protein
VVNHGPAPNGLVVVGHWKTHDPNLGHDYKDRSLASLG